MYKEIPCSNVRRFISDTEDEVLYIIKMGFQDEYLAVYESAYGDGEIVFRGSKKETETNFDIEL